jgi:hypothetical protein
MDSEVYRNATCKLTRAPQAEQDKEVAIQRDTQRARLKKEKEEKAELRGKYADDKCARKEEGWRAQV